MKIYEAFCLSNREAMWAFAWSVFCEEAEIAQLVIVPLRHLASAGLGT